MPPRKQYETHEQYIADMALEAQPVLTKIQALVEAKVANTTRCISYGMPAFRRGKVFFYFAAFKQHIGIYPPLKQEPALIKQLAPWRGPKGNLAFPLSEKMPYELIGKVAATLAAQYAPVLAPAKVAKVKAKPKAKPKAVKVASQKPKVSQ